MKNRVQIVNIVFIVSVLMTMLCEYIDVLLGVVIFKPAIVLSVLYLYTLNKDSRTLLYEAGLILALLSNIFFIDRDSKLTLFLGVLCTVLYVIIFILIIVKETKRRNLLAVGFASLPFMIFATYEIIVLKDNLGSKLWLIIVAAFAICLFCGLSFYTFFLKNTRKTVFLVISGLCMFSMCFLFAMEAYFISSDILRIPIIAAFAIFQYSFYRYVVEDAEEQPDYLEESIL